MSTSSLLEPIKEGFSNVAERMLGGPHQAMEPEDLEKTQIEISRIEKKFLDICRRQQIRRQPELTKEALSLKNLANALWYASWLNRPALVDPVELEQSIRFVVESEAQDENIAGIFDACWRNPRWLLRFPPSLGKGLLMNKALHKIRESALLSRPAGARGNIAKCATRQADKAELIDKIESWYEDAPDETRREIALTLGECGGELEVEQLEKWLHSTNPQSESVKRGIFSALANIGGPVAVDTLLKAGETALKMTALAAIGSLEFLASGGSTALTEPPEPPIIDSRELEDAYKVLAGRLKRLSNLETVDDYVRYKAGELLDTIRLALRKQPAA